MIAFFEEEGSVTSLVASRRGLSLFSMQRKDRRRSKIFISYRRDDSSHAAARIYETLISAFGKGHVFMDVDNIPPGVDFAGHIQDVLADCAVVLAIIGDHWTDASYTSGDRNGTRRLDDPSDFVRIEIESALTSDIPVIPVLVGLNAIPSKEGLPPSLHRLVDRNGVEVRAGRDLRAHLARLTKGLKDSFDIKRQWWPWT